MRTASSPADRAEGVLADPRIRKRRDGRVEKTAPSAPPRRTGARAAPARGRRAELRAHRGDRRAAAQGGPRRRRRCRGRRGGRPSAAPTRLPALPRRGASWRRSRRRPRTTPPTTNEDDACARRASSAQRDADAARRSPTCSTRSRRTCSASRSSPRRSASPASPRSRSTSSTSTARGCCAWPARRVPRELAAPLAVGPEIPREGIAGLRGLIERELPGSVVAPLCCAAARIGVLLAVGATDDGARRARPPGRRRARARATPTPTTSTSRGARKRPSPAAEIQQNLLPPRIVRIDGASIAGNVLPATRSAATGSTTSRTPAATWIGMADAEGSGTRAAALGVRRARRVPRRAAPVAADLPADDQAHGHRRTRDLGGRDRHDDDRLLGAADIDVLMDLLR